jgi:hypothetical protein
MGLRETGFEGFRVGGAVEVFSDEDEAVERASPLFHLRSKLASKRKCTPWETA